MAARDSRSYLRRILNISPLQLTARAKMTASTKTWGCSSAMSLYTDGLYLEKNPNWHIDESPFKVKQILRMMAQDHLKPKTICEVGCGAGEVLRLLQQQMDEACVFWGYDISPQALEMCRSRQNERLRFKLADLGEEEGAYFDLILVLDVLEHVEDYFTLLRRIKPKSPLKVFHIPLDLSVQAVCRRTGLLARRQSFGHLHYFTKETALQTLQDVGYQVLDYFYTPRCIELTSYPIQRLLKLPRRICFALHEDLTVRFLGGYSLLVLAK